MIPLPSYEGGRFVGGEKAALVTVKDGQGGRDVVIVGGAVGDGELGDGVKGMGAPFLVDGGWLSTRS